MTEEWKHTQLSPKYLHSKQAWLSYFQNLILEKKQWFKKIIQNIDVLCQKLFFQTNSEMNNVIYSLLKINTI